MSKRWHFTEIRFPPEQKTKLQLPCDQAKEKPLGMDCPKLLRHRFISFKPIYTAKSERALALIPIFAKIFVSCVFSSLELLS